MHFVVVFQFTFFLIQRIGCIIYCMFQDIYIYIPGRTKRKKKLFTILFPELPYLVLYAHVFVCGAHLYNIYSLTDEFHSKHLKDFNSLQLNEYLHSSISIYSYTCTAHNWVMINFALRFYRKVISFWCNIASNIAWGNTCYVDFKT